MWYINLDLFFSKLLFILPFDKDFTILPDLSSSGWTKLWKISWQRFYFEAVLFFFQISPLPKFHLPLNPTGWWLVICQYETTAKFHNLKQHKMCVFSENWSIWGRKFGELEQVCDGETKMICRLLSMLWCQPYLYHCSTTQIVFSVKTNKFVGAGKSLGRRNNDDLSIVEKQQQPKPSSFTTGFSGLKRLSNTIQYNTTG